MTSEVRAVPRDKVGAQRGGQGGGHSEGAINEPFEGSGGFLEPASEVSVTEKDEIVGGQTALHNGAPHSGRTLPPPTALLFWESHGSSKRGTQVGQEEGLPKHSRNCNKADSLVLPGGLKSRTEAENAHSSETSLCTSAASCPEPHQLPGFPPQGLPCPGRSAQDMRPRTLAVSRMTSPGSSQAWSHLATVPSCTVTQTTTHVCSHGHTCQFLCTLPAPQARRPCLSPSVPAYPSTSS